MNRIEAKESAQRQMDKYHTTPQKTSLFQFSLCSPLSPLGKGEKKREREKKKNTSQLLLVD